LEDIRERYKDSSIKTYQDIERVFNPEDKDVILDSLLEWVDSKIESGKIISKREGGIVGAKTFRLVVSPLHVERIYQFPASIKEKRVVSAADIMSMNIEEYIKKYFDYDLRSDKKRYADLKKYTNMFD